MPLTSLTYLGFLSGVAVLFSVLPQRAARNLLLLTASYVFYGWITRWYPILLAGSTLVTYACLLCLWRGRSVILRRSALTVGIVAHIGMLALCKYGSIFTPMMTPGWGLQSFAENLLLPIGMSFYALQAVGLMVDAYRRDLAGQPILTIAVFLAFFPKLTSGPFEKSSRFIAQLESQLPGIGERIAAACPLILWGIFKKLAVADAVQVYAELLLERGHGSLLLVAAGSICFAVQILADFSGYTDIARGSAKLFGIDLMENFNFPYLALTPSDFWRRWHISLSQWFRDYVFIPLGGSRHRSWWRVLIVFLITMGLSGMWHGVTANFAVWGLYYGLLLFVYRAIGLDASWKPKTKLSRVTAWVVMSALTLFGWVIFTAPTVQSVLDLFVASRVVPTIYEVAAAMSILTLTAAFVVPWMAALVILQKAQRPWWRGLAYTLLIVALVLNAHDTPLDFLYVRF